MDTQVKTPEPTIINGINVDDLRALIAEVDQDPRKAATHWRVGTTWLGQTRSRAQVEGFGFGGETRLASSPWRWTSRPSWAARTSMQTRKNT